MNLTIHHSNGNLDVDVETMDKVRRMLEDQYGPEVVIHDEWEPAGRAIERLLVWANQEDADDDAGSNAVAEVTRRIPDTD